MSVKASFMCAFTTHDSLAGREGRQDVPRFGSAFRETW